MASRSHLIALLSFLLFSTVLHAGEIENHSFGVIRENSSTQNQALLLYISNQDCVAKYRVAVNELIIGDGEIDVKKFKKTIPFGSSTIQITCGTQNSLSVTYK